MSGLQRVLNLVIAVAIGNAGMAGLVHRVEWYAWSLLGAAVGIIALALLKACETPRVDEVDEHFETTPRELPPPVLTLIEGDRRPVWDTDTWGAPE